MYQFIREQAKIHLRQVYEAFPEISDIYLYGDVVSRSFVKDKSSITAIAIGNVNEEEINKTLQKVSSLRLYNFSIKVISEQELDYYTRKEHVGRVSKTDFKVHEGNWEEYEKHYLGNEKRS